MAFHPRKVLAHLSMLSLKTYLESSAPRLSALVDWQGSDAEVRKRIEQLLLADAAEPDIVLASLQRVFQLGGSRGDRAMVAACGADIALRQELSARANSHERALWLLTQQPELFERAEGICESDHRYGGRSWSGFVGPRDAWPDLAGESGELFKAQLETIFRPTDGSGARVVVDAFERGPASIGRYGEGRVFHLIAYLEGLPATSTEFADTGVVRRNVRPAVEVTLVYATETGVIDIIAGAGREQREQVARAFVEELFPQDAGLEPVRLREIVLSSLARTRPFPVDPEDGIDHVHLAELRIEPNGGSGRVTLEAVRGDGPTLHELSRRWFGSSDPLARDPRVIKARLSIRFPKGNGRRRARTLQVMLTEPHGCNLRDRSDEERLVGEKYLRRWDLLRDL